MVKKLAGYGVGLIALYLAVANASGTGTVITSGAQGLSTVTKTLQGRG
jgi:hypothetical protein